MRCFPACSLVLLLVVGGQAYAEAVFLSAGETRAFGENAQVYGGAGEETVVINGEPTLQLDANIERVLFPGLRDDYDVRIQGTRISLSKSSVTVVTFTGLNQPVSVSFQDGTFELVLTGLNLATLAGAPVPTASQEPSSDCPVETSEPPISPGPYDHVLSVATSTDGLNFSGSKPSLLARASAPDAVVGPDGKVWVYYVNGTPGQHGIFIARVNDDGTVTSFDCVRIEGAFDAEAVDPDVLRLSDGRYQLFYNPLVSANSQQVEGIYTAISEDGIHFSGNRQLVQLDGALNPSAVQLNSGRWLLTYTDESRVYVDQSEDGSIFQRVGDFTAGIPEISYLSETNEVRLYNAEKTGLVVRASVDNGINWAEVSAAAPHAQDPSVLQLADDAWVLYYRFESVED